jgi:hypothetical protein
MPSDEGVHSIHGTEDFDDIWSGDDGSNKNVHNGNDDEALNNNASGDEVHGALYE